MIEDYDYNKFGTKIDAPVQPTISGIGAAAVDTANEPVNPSNLQDGNIESEIQMVRGHMQSSNFVSGQVGWQIKYDGSAEFQNVNIGNKIITINSTQSISEAIASINAVGGGVLNLKAGTYTITTPLIGISNLQIIGESSSTTILDFNSTAANLSFTGTNVYSTGTITVASGVNITGSGTSWLANVTAGQYLFLGTRWYSIAAVTGDTSLILSEAYGDNVTLPSTYRIATIKRNIFVKQLGILNSTGTGLAITDCREIVLSDILFLDNNIGYALENVSLCNQTRLLPVSNTSHGYTLTNVGLCSLLNVNSEGNGGSGVVISNMKTVSMNDSTGSANTADGMNATTVVDCILNGGFSGNGGQGMEFVSGCNNNNVSSIVQGNTSDGIKLTATDDNNKFYGCSITGNGGYGINVAASTDDTNVISSNNFAGNSSGAVNDAGTGTVIRGNVGVADNGISQAGFASGQVAYTGDGTTPDAKTIAHGLGATPRLVRYFYTALTASNIATNIGSGAYSASGQSCTFSYSAVAQEPLTRLSTITQSAIGTTQSGYTVSHTTDADTTLLVVIIANGTDTTAATFNGDSMTEFAAQGGGSRPSVFYLLNPDIGTYDIATTATSSDDHAIIAYNFSGNDMTTPLEDAQAPASDTGSVTVTTTRDFSIIVGMLGTNNAAATVAMSTGTERLDAAGTNYKWSAGDQSATSAGAQTVTFTYSAGTARMIAVAVRPASSAGGSNAQNSTNIIEARDSEGAANFVAALTVDATNLTTTFNTFVLNSTIKIQWEAYV